MDRDTTQGMKSVPYSPHSKISFWKVSLISIPHSHQSTSHLHHSHTVLKSLHHLDSLVELPLSFKFLQDSYLVSKISFYKPLSTVANLHFHLANKAILNSLMSLIPNPPCSLGLHILAHFIHAIFLRVASQPHRKSLCILVMTLHTLAGVLKKEKKYNGVVVNTYLIRQVLPAKDKNLPFHLASFFLILLTTISKA